MSAEAPSDPQIHNGVVDVQLPCYRDLQWRVDVILDSRLARGLSEPQYTLELSYTEDGVVKRKYMSCDFKTLVEMTQSIGTAVAQMNTASVKRVQRLVPF